MVRQRKPNLKAMLRTYLGFDAFTDLTCAAIPVYLIQRLRMNRRTKIALCCLMGLGAM